MGSWMVDQQDRELMNSLQALGPLLLGTRKSAEANDEDRHSKRHKPVASEDRHQEQTAPVAMAHLLRVVAQLVLNHERSLNNLFKQDCFVLYASADPQGAIPLLQDLAQQWKSQQTTPPTPQASQQWQTMRTFLLAGLMKELNCRAKQLSNSKAGEKLWDTALQKGTLCAAGGWNYQKWSPDQQTLVPAQKASLPMPRMLKLLDTVDELLQHNSHVVRFHSLKAQGPVIPWCLQVTMRDPELWTLLGSITHNTVWSLMGMTVKQHNQQMSKPAQLLAETLQKQGLGKGPGKGKQKGKQPKQQ